MSASRSTRLQEVLRDHHDALLESWLAELEHSALRREDLMSEGQLREQCESFLDLLVTGSSQEADITNVQAPGWKPLRDYLGRLVRTRSEQGFSPREVALFIFQLKKPLVNQLRAIYSDTKDADRLADETWKANELLDQLGLHALDWSLNERQEIIARQQQEMLELSTPVISLWEGVLALPLIGTLDSARTQIVMETLLERIASSGARIAILDITGVATVDTLVAQHLMKTVTAARLMGADCIISGIRPQIAQTIIHLGVDLHDITTKSTLAEALGLALRRLGVAVQGAPSHVRD